MHNHTEHLTQEERNLLVKAPLYVSVLIAGADGDVKNEEKARVVELVHIKSFSEHHGINELYKELDHDVAEELRNLIASLPDETVDRSNMLSDILAGLNNVLPKCSYAFSSHFYKSLREFAHYVATADGGFWGVGAITAAEAEWVKLPMIDQPVNNEA